MIKNIFFVTILVITVNTLNAQNWTYSEGYTMGKNFCKQNQKAQAIATVNYANSIGEINYSIGVAEGFTYGCNRNGSFTSSISSCFIKFLTGGLDAYNKCQNPQMDNSSTTQNRIANNSIKDTEETTDNIKVIVYPNPTNSILKFEGKNLKNYKISIFNYLGNEIIKNSIDEQGINIEKQEKGIYFYIITDDSGYKQEGRIIKE